MNEIEAPFPDQSAEPGKEVLVYRVKRKDGVVLEEEFLGRDYYYPVRGKP